MNKAELITAIAKHANLTKADANRALDGLLKTIETILASGDSVALICFGSFEVKARAERKGRNPQTGEEIEFYNAVREQDDSPWFCDIIDEAMFDLLNEKYEIDRTGGFQDQLREHVNKSKMSLK
jgi:DNA-binding protein HU-beta